MHEVVTRYKDLDSQNKSLKTDLEELAKHFQESQNQSHQDILRLKANLNLNLDERNNVGENFKQMLSTNKSLQQELEVLQEQLGKKEAEIVFLSKDR